MVPVLSFKTLAKIQRSVSNRKELGYVIYKTNKCLCIQRSCKPSLTLYSLAFIENSYRLYYKKSNKQFLLWFLFVCKILFLCLPLTHNQYGASQRPVLKLRHGKVRDVSECIIKQALPVVVINSWLLEYLLLVSRTNRHSNHSI